jgi:hypothetical protein
MNGVAPEVAKEITVLFDDRDIHARSCQQETQHHPRRPCPCNDACRLDVSHLIHRSVSPESMESIKLHVVAAGPEIKPALVSRDFRL